MTTHHDVTIQFQVVEIDNGDEYIGCSFRHCQIIYSAKGPVNLVAPTFNNCEWTFKEKAADTLQLLRALYTCPGGQKLIDLTLGRKDG